MAFQVQRAKTGPRYIGWGYTKLRNWRNCPRQHLETDIEKKWVETGDNENLEFGNAVHTALEKRILEAVPIPPHLQANLKGDMEHWCRKVLGGFRDATDFEIATKGLLKGEQQLAMGEDFAPCGWFDKKVNVWLRAKLDIMKIVGPACLLLDWKTGKVSDREQDQLAISAAMVFAHFPQVQAVRSVYVWLKEGTDVTTTMDIRRTDLPAFWAGILPEVNQYRKDLSELNMPPKPSGLCGWCRVKSCEHNPHQNS